MDEEKPEKKVESAIKNLTLDDGNRLSVDRKEVREKGRLLDEMKEIFGKDQEKELYQFIDKNFSLGQEAIVQQWIETEFAKNSKN